MTISKEHFRQTMANTPFHERVESFSQVHEWTSWNGYKIASVLDQLSAEYFAVRSACSVMDMTPMEKYRVSGPDALAYLDRLLTRNLSKLRPGRVTYVVWCNDEGKLLDDGTLYQLGENDYRLCAQHHQLDWLLISAAGFDVEIKVETDNIAALAVQGPTSFSVLKAAGFVGVEDLKPFDVSFFELNSMPVLISRTGYTGDLGYELWMSPAHALSVWDAIFGLTDLYNICPIGLSALEMVRTEAGFVMPGFDFNTAETPLRAGYDRSPYEAGLGWVVNLDKGHFTGRAALRQEKGRPITRRLHKIVVEGNKPAAHALIYDAKKGNKTGEIKVAVWSPILKKNVALADINYINGKIPGDLWARLDYQRELEWHSKWERCEVVKDPFLVPSHRSLTPPDAL